MALDATVAGPDADSYVSVADATAYLAKKAGAGAWASTLLATQEARLQEATRMIDNCRFWGARSSMSQALEFPRMYPYNSDKPCWSGAPEVPRAVRHATIEQAWHLLANEATGGQTKRQQLQAGGVTSFTIGSLSETFGSESAAPSPLLALCPDARATISRWIQRGGRITTEREQTRRRTL